MVNARREELDVPFELGPDILKGKKVQKVYDGETGFAFRPHYDRERKQYVLGEMKAGCFGMPPCGVRMLVVE